MLRRSCAAVLNTPVDEQSPQYEDIILAFESAVRERNVWIGELRKALSESIGTMRIFHGAAGWQAYYDHSPEMKRWRAALEDRPRIG
jgi:hypothetical protein